VPLLRQHLHLPVLEAWEALERKVSELEPQQLANLTHTIYITDLVVVHLLMVSLEVAVSLNPPICETISALADPVTKVLTHQH
jgi:hypothetical protein